MTTRNLNQAEVGWLAGIIDGEGAIVLVQGSYRRKSDGRRPISARVMMAVTSFEILQKYTALLSQAGVDYGYVMQAEFDLGRGRLPRVNVNIHKHASVSKFLKLILPYLSEKKDRAQLALDLVRWKDEHGQDLMHRYSALPRSLLDEEQEFWERYRILFAGRGPAQIKRRTRKLENTIRRPSTPIHYPD